MNYLPKIETIYIQFWILGSQKTMLNNVVVLFDGEEKQNCKRFYVVLDFLENGNLCSTMLYFFV